MNTMKTIIFSIIMGMALMGTYAGEGDYEAAMKQNLVGLNKATTAADYQQLANSFERISQAAAGEWLPYYYISYCYLNYCFAEGAPTEGIDGYLDKAETFLGKARELSPANAEIEVLQGWIHQGRIQVDPMGRGMVYSEKASASFGKAKAIDPENPRVYFLTGMNIMYTPEMFGGGKTAACPYFLIAKEKFSKFEPASEIAPDWGMEYNNELANGCEL